MMRFPVIRDEAEPPLPRMTLVEYAHFSERCLRSNPAVTPENCLTKRADEADMPRPFSLFPAQAGRTDSTTKSSKDTKEELVP